MTSGMATSIDQSLNPKTQLASYFKYLKKRTKHLSYFVRQPYNIQRLTDKARLELQLRN